jgi:hypothetical protein
MRENKKEKKKKMACFGVGLDVLRGLCGGDLDVDELLKRRARPLCGLLLLLGPGPRELLQATVSIVDIEYVFELQESKES